MAKLDYDALNSTLRYLMFSVFSVRPRVLGEQRDAVIDDAATFFKLQEERGVVVRGVYDVAGLRADADFMIWTHAERVEALQATYADFRRTTSLGRACSPVWSSVALHRQHLRGPIPLVSPSSPRVRRLTTRYGQARHHHSRRQP